MTRPAAAADRGTFIGRLLTTPLSRLLRGDLAGRHSPSGWREALRESRLPHHLSQLVEQTTRRSRLWVREKDEVAAELIAHFVDGLQSGRTGDELSASFGDPGRAARLIRRSKRRQRSPLWHAWIGLWRLVAASVGLVILTYGVLAAFHFTGSPTLTRNITSELNAPALAVPERDRAWPLYAEALLALDPLPDELRRAWPSQRPGWRTWDRALAYHAEQEDVLRLIAQAADKPALGAILSDRYDEHMTRIIKSRDALHAEPWPDARWPKDNPPVFGLLLPYLPELRSLARVVAFDARLAALEGRGERVVHDVRLMLRMADHADDPPVLVGQLVRLALANLAIDVIVRTIDEHPAALSERDLRDLAHELASLTDDRLRVTLGAERLMMVDLAQRVFTDDGGGRGRLTPDGIALLRELGAAPDFEPTWDRAAGPILMALNAGRRANVELYNQLMDEQQAEASRPLWERSAAQADARIERLASDAWGSTRYFPMAAIVPAIQRAVVSGDLSMMQRDAAAVVIAAELFRRREGRWPESLAELTPALLPAVPIDRFIGGPLRYRLSDAGPVIYSVGTDRRDDGGERPENQVVRRNVREWMPRDKAEAMLTRERPRPTEDCRGDWVLYPPDPAEEPEPDED